MKRLRDWTRGRFTSGGHRGYRRPRPNPGVVFVGIGALIFVVGLLVALVGGPEESVRPLSSSGPSANYDETYSLVQSHLADKRVSLVTRVDTPSSWMIRAKVRLTVYPQNHPGPTSERNSCLIATPVNVVIGKVPRTSKGVEMECRAALVPLYFMDQDGTWQPYN